METKAAVENVKIGQMIKAHRTSGGFDEGYYLGTTDFNQGPEGMPFEQGIVIGYPAHFKECVAPYREYDIALQPLTMRGSLVTDIEIIEGDSMTPDECFDLLTEGGFGALIPEALWSIVDNSEASHG